MECQGTTVAAGPGLSGAGKTGSVSLENSGFRGHKKRFGCTLRAAGAAGFAAGVALGLIFRDPSGGGERVRLLRPLTISKL